MARRIVHQLVDDLDGHPAGEGRQPQWAVNGNGTDRARSAGESVR